jgi:hypothetical protein
MTDRTVYRLEKEGTRTILADRFEGKRFNGPNDIVVKSDGAVYFTDTVWGLRGAAQSPQREIPFSGFFLIKDGKVTLLGGDRDNPNAAPNGITLSPDEKYLYVTAGTRRTMRYDILPDDTVANGRVFVEDGIDGMRVDTNRQPLHHEWRNTRPHPDQFPRRQTDRTSRSCHNRRVSPARAFAPRTWLLATMTIADSTSPRARISSKSEPKLRAFVPASYAAIRRNLAADYTDCAD